MTNAQQIAKLCTARRALRERADAAHMVPQYPGDDRNVAERAELLARIARINKRIGALS